MATLPERMAVVETKVAVIEKTTKDTHGDVKELLQWRDEERGARLAERSLRDAHDARMSSRAKSVGLFLTALTIGLNILFRVFPWPS